MPIKEYPNRLIELKCPNCLQMHMPEDDLVIRNVMYFEQDEKLMVDFKVIVFCRICDSNIYETRIFTELKESNLIKKGGQNELTK